MIMWEKKILGGKHPHPHPPPSSRNGNIYKKINRSRLVCIQIARKNNGPFAASGHMVHAGGQAAHWDIQNKENSNLS